MTQSFSLERFAALLEAYGARLSLWPEDERQAANALLGRSEEARALMLAEAELDAAFSSAAAPPAVSADLLRRLNEVPLRAPEHRSFWRLPTAWVPAFAWSLAAVVGLGWGIQSGPFELDESEDTSVATVETAASDTTPTDQDELAELDQLTFGALAELEE